MASWRRRHLAVFFALLFGSAGLASSPASAACSDGAAPGVDWQGCSLQRADLSSADLSGADLQNADLQLAILFGANLAGADLRGANLSEAFPVGANLSGANLTGANLTDASLVGANLQGAILRNAVMTATDVDRSLISEASFIGADLTNAEFNNISGASSAAFAVTPTASDDAARTWRDRAVHVRFLANDDSALDNTFAARSIEITRPPVNGEFDPVSGLYTPDAGFSGDDEVRYRLVSILPWTNLPQGVSRRYESREATIAIEVLPTVTLSEPYLGAAGVEGEVARLYVAIFRRPPDAAGFEFWSRTRSEGTSLSDVAAFFISSSEFLADHGEINDTEFVTLLYHNVLEREPDVGGLEFWVARLGQGQERSAVVLQFSESTEFGALTGTS